MWRVLKKGILRSKLIAYGKNTTVYKNSIIKVVRDT